MLGSLSLPARRLLLGAPALVSSLVAQPTPAAPSAPIAITNVAVVDVASGQISDGQTVLLKAGRISRVGSAARIAVPPGMRRLDGRGKFLIPGLWDMHVHAMQTADPTRQRRIFDLFIANGVTGIRDMGSHLDTLLAVRAQIASGAFAHVPHIVAAGPLLDGPKFRWSQAVAWHLSTPADVAPAVDSLVRVRVNFLKAYGSLPRDVFLALAAKARAVGLPMAGHIPLSVTSSEAIAAGMTSFEHNGMDITDVCVDSASARINRALNRWAREGYGAWYAERLAYSRSRHPAVCAAHYAQIRDRGVRLVPTLVLELRDDRALRSPGIPYLDSLARVACEGTVRAITSAPDSVRVPFVDAFLRDVRAQRDAGIQFLAGSDLPNPCLVPGFSLHDELAAMVQAGLTPREALAAATTAPATFLRREAMQGRIAPGQLADLVLLDANPLQDINNVRRVRAVVRNGRLLARPTIDGLLARSRP
jgi:hypothetical protein